MIKKEKYLNRYNIYNYVKENPTESYFVMKDEILDCLINIADYENKPRNNFINTYIILFQKQEEYNNDLLTGEEKAKKYFGISKSTLRKTLYIMEQNGFIIQERRGKKCTGRIWITDYFRYIDSDNYKKHIKHLKNLNIKLKTKEINYD